MINWKSPITYVVILIILIICLVGGLAFLYSRSNAAQGNLTPPTPTSGQSAAPVVDDSATQTAAAFLAAQTQPGTPTATFIPTQAPTSTPLPTFTPMPTFTATVAPFNGIVINDCPDSFMGYHPDSGEKLEFALMPYAPDDTNVICIFEAFSLDQEIKVDFSNGVVAIVADWSHGTYNEDGTLKDACPTGWECEGTWVAKSDIIIPIGTIAKIYVYKQEQPARQRFTETISWAVPAPGSMAPFACEYIAKEGHDMRNIRVAAWAVNGKNTIYGFAIPLGLEGHLTCAGYESWNPTPLP